jgi:hypothetical protein
VKAEVRRLTIRAIGSLRETSTGNRWLECHTDLGIVAFWGDPADSRNIRRVQALTPPVVVTAGTIASRWSQHAWWVPQSADVAPFDEAKSNSSQPHEPRAGASGGQERGQEHRERSQDTQQHRAVDPYLVLGVQRGASPQQIRAAYLACIKQYHPDQVAHLVKELRDLAHQKSQEINWAYEMLTGGRGT